MNKNRTEVKGVQEEEEVEREERKIILILFRA